MLDKMEESRKRELSSKEDFDRLDMREKDLLDYRRHIQEQEKQLDDYRSKLKHEQLLREKEFQKELDEREKFFATREKKLLERQREFEEHLLLREKESEHLRARLENELVAKHSELEHMKSTLQKEKELYREESRKKIETTSKDYVVEALDILGKKETEFHSWSKIWAWIGAGALAVGLIFFVFITFYAIVELPNPISWEFIVFAFFKGLIAVGLFGALAKYALIFSKSYMKEALKSADRRHAINFGKFYLESYGAAADWSQIKEAFEHWNITGEGDLTKPVQTELDTPTIEKLTSALEVIGKSLPLIGKK